MENSFRKKTSMKISLEPGERQEAYTANSTLNNLIFIQVFNFPQKQQ